MRSRWLRLYVRSKTVSRRYCRRFESINISIVVPMPHRRLTVKRKSHPTYIFRYGFLLISSNKFYIKLIPPVLISYFFRFFDIRFFPFTGKFSETMFGTLVHAIYFYKKYVSLQPKNFICAIINISLRCANISVKIVSTLFVQRSKSV